MRTIEIKKDGDRWGAFYEGKRVAASSCRPCVVSAVLKVTKESSKYGYITIFNEDGTPSKTILTGVHDGRQGSQTLQGS